MNHDPVLLAYRCDRVARRLRRLARRFEVLGEWFLGDNCLWDEHPLRSLLCPKPRSGRSGASSGIFSGNDDRP